MSFSSYLETKILQHVFAGASYSAPATIYVSLFTSTPSATSAGTEVAGGAYARMAITPSSGMTVTTTTPPNVQNKGTITFPTATASWGTVIGAGLYDALSGGNLLHYGTISNARLIDSGDIIILDPSDYMIELS